MIERLKGIDGKTKFGKFYAIWFLHPNSSEHKICKGK